MLQNEDENYVFTLWIDSVANRGGTALDTYAAVVMMDTLFNIKWKLYLNKGTGGAFYPTRVIELKDSSYVLVVMNTQPYSSIFHYYKISKTGQILGHKTFTSSICNKVHSTEIKVLSDGSLLVSGACDDNSPPVGYIARIDSVDLPMVITNTVLPQHKSVALNVEVYPNPFSQSTVFKINSNSNSSYQLSILNSLGEEISSYNFSGKEFTLNASDFSSGLYMYVLRDGEGKIKSGKLVVE
jgi:hypothetical protein